MDGFASDAATALRPDGARAQENGLALDLPLSEEQVERIRFEREAHLDMIKWRSGRPAAGRAALAAGWAADVRAVDAQSSGGDAGVEQEPDGSEETAALSFEAEQAALVTSFTIGSVFPAGRINPALMALTPLRPVGRPKRSGGLSKLGGGLGSASALSTNNTAPRPPNEETAAAPADAWDGPDSSETHLAKEDAAAAAQELPDSWETFAYDSVKPDLNAHEEPGAAAGHSHEPRAIAPDLTSNAKPALEVEDAQALEDAPLFIIDASLYREHGLATEQDIRGEVFDQLCTSHKDLDAICESLFEGRAFFHSTRRSVATDLARLQRRMPEKEFAVVEYPAAVYDETREEMLNTMHVWEDIQSMCLYDCGGRGSLLSIKEHVQRCSRTIMWKKAMLEELDRLAEKEELAQMERQETLERLDALSKLQGEIELLLQETDPETDPELVSGCKEQLEVVRASVLEAQDDVDRLRAENFDHLGADASEGQHDGLEASESEPAERDRMSVVDMILAMVLQRCDVDWRPHEGPEDFLKRIASKHHALAAHWKDDFGRLPYLPRS